MQKAYFTVILTLALYLAAAEYTVEEYGFIKRPVPVCSDNETACTNATHLQLDDFIRWNIYVLAYNTPIFNGSSSNATWSVLSKRFADKDLSVLENMTSSFTAPPVAMISYGYALSIETEKIDNIAQLFLYRTSIDDDQDFQRVQLTRNTNATFAPSVAGFTVYGTTLLSFILVAEKTVNAILPSGKTNILEATLSTNFGGQISGVILRKSPRVLAIWTEGDVLKQAALDFQEKSVSVTTGDVANYNKHLHKKCQAFVTATKEELYGALCTGFVVTTMNIYVAVLSNDKGLVKLTDDTAGATEIQIFPHNKNLAFIFTNKIDPDDVTCSKAIWDLETMKAVLNSTKFLSHDSKTEVSYHKILTKGVYMLAYDKVNASAPCTNAKVGLLIQSPSDGKDLLTVLVTVIRDLIQVFGGIIKSVYAITEYTGKPETQIFNTIAQILEIIKQTRFFVILFGGGMEPLHE